MKVSGICLFILVCAALLVSGVSAQNVDKNAGYNITPVKNLHLHHVVTPMSVGTITQGETDWYYYVVSSGTSSITADLNWGGTSDSLSLTIVAPDGTIGPYYDAADGIANGRITLMITRTGGLAPGTWRFKVYGDQVTGLRSYNFLVY